MKVSSNVLLGLSAVSVIAGDLFAKWWSTDRRWVLALAALLGYLGSGAFYLPVLLAQPLVVSSMLWCLASIAGFTLIGVVIFGEHLSLIQVIGLGFGSLALVLMGVES